MATPFYKVRAEQVEIVKSGRTQGMILAGYNGVPGGRVQFQDESNPDNSGYADVTALRQVQLRDLEPRELNELGYRDLDAAVTETGLRPDSNVTAVFWNKKNDGPQSFSDLDKLPPAPEEPEDKGLTPGPGDATEPPGDAEPVGV